MKRLTATRSLELLNQMSIEEKVGQLQQFFWFGEAASHHEMLRIESEKAREAIGSGRIGSVLFVSKAREIEALQRAHMAACRLKIPLLFAFDVIHGFRTIFPVPIAMAASWDIDIVEQCQTIAAQEARAEGIHWAFAPMVDVARDPRWGRMVEGGGEDACLGSEIAAAQVRGLQGNDLRSTGVMACVKHFAGYGAALGGRDYDEVNLSDYELQNTYLPPFHAAVEAGCASVMTAYMPLNGVPATASPMLLQDVLRKQWSFSGLVVSDANAVVNLVTHGFARDLEDASIRALSAGLDMEMTTGTSAFSSLIDAVKGGRVAQGLIDDAVFRVLYAKEQIGLFDEPAVSLRTSSDAAFNRSARDTARRAASRTAVLLKNDGVLPLGNVGRLALTGPLASARRDQLGPWVFEHSVDDTISIADGLREQCEGHIALVISDGVRMPQRLMPWPFGVLHELDDAEDWRDFDADAALALAVADARDANVAIVVVGERYDMSGEIASRSGLALPGEQERLVKAIAATGTPVVLVIVAGRPVDLSGIVELCGAILCVWHAGSAAGDAVADLLLGQAAPAGRLPFTWPRSVGQVPIIHNHVRSHDPAGRGRRYWDEPSTPLFPFGFGLGYTTFSYTDMRVEVQRGLPEPVVSIQVELRNMGGVAAEEVVQLYIGQRSGSSARPVRELKAFCRAQLAPGTSRKIEFELDARALRHWSSGTRSWVVDAADFEVWIGGDSLAELRGQFTIPPQGT